MGGDNVDKTEYQDEIWSSNSKEFDERGICQ
jgi:hypothetical protein